jgi:hypothetical protein
MNVPRLRLFFRDSFNFLQSSLDKLPETFNLETRSKGHFPHLFNRRENLGVPLDQLPPLRYYCPDTMKPAAREALLKWHAENIDKGFLLEREMATYCKSFII